MSQNVIRTKCPVVQCTLESFVQFQHVGGEHRRFTFDKPIVWIQESESSLQYWHGGKVLKDGPTWGDYYGYLGSIHLDYDEVPGVYAAEYGITQESSLELRLTTVIRKIPYLETEADKLFNEAQREGQDRQYSPIPDGWRKEQPCTYSPTGLYYPELEKIEVCRAMVWTSKLDRDGNAQLRADFLEEWAS